MAKLLVALAESEKELGINISDAQISQMKENIYNIDYDYALAREREVRHNVMSHVLAFGAACPDAKPIIHLGATSCYVGDNTDIILMREALLHIKSIMIGTLEKLTEFAEKYKALPTLAYTHFRLPSLQLWESAQLYGQMILLWTFSSLIFSWII